MSLLQADVLIDFMTVIINGFPIYDSNSPCSECGEPIYQLTTLAGSRQGHKRAGFSAELAG